MAYLSSILKNPALLSLVLCLTASGLSGCGDSNREGNVAKRYDENRPTPGKPTPIPTKPTAETGWGTLGYAQLAAIAHKNSLRYLDIAMFGHEAPGRYECERVETEQQSDTVRIITLKNSGCGKPFGGNLKMSVRTNSAGKVEKVEVKNGSVRLDLSGEKLEKNIELEENVTISKTSDSKFDVSYELDFESQESTDRRSLDLKAILQLKGEIQVAENVPSLVVESTQISSSRMANDKLVDESDVVLEPVGVTLTNPSCFTIDGKFNYKQDIKPEGKAKESSNAIEVEFSSSAVAINAKNMKAFLPTCRRMASELVQITQSAANIINGRQLKEPAKIKKKKDNDTDDSKKSKKRNNLRNSSVTSDADQNDDE